MLNEKAHSEADLNINVEGVMQRGGNDSILSFFFLLSWLSPPSVSSRFYLNFLF